MRGRVLTDGAFAGREEGQNKALKSSQIRVTFTELKYLTGNRRQEQDNGLQVSGRLA